MPDSHEPTGFELMRALADMRAESARRDDATNRRLDGLMSAAGLTEIIRRLDSKDSDNTKDITKVDGKVDTLGTKVDTQIAVLTARVDTKFTQLTNRIWWVLSAILLPIGFYIVAWLQGAPS